MKPVLLEIVTKLITLMDQWGPCKILLNEAGMRIEETIDQKEIEAYPPEIKEESIKLSQWIRELSHLYRHRLLIKLIPAQSILGFYKSLRYGIRTYPSFIVEGKKVYSGWQKERLEELIDQSLKTSSPKVRV